MKWTLLKCLFWNANDWVIRLMVSFTSCVSLQYRPCCKNMLNYDNDNKCIANLWQCNTATQLGGEGGGLPCPFLKIKKSVLISLKKNAPIVSIPRLNLPFKMYFWEYLGEKNPKFFPAGPFFFNFWGNISRKALISWKLPCLEKFLVVRLQY